MRSAFICLFASAASAFAQDLPKVLELKPFMSGNIWKTPFLPVKPDPSARFAGMSLPVAPKVCSVRLIEAKPTTTDQHSIWKPDASATVAMPETQVPAPACAKQ
jgi:hypothetical protein